MTPVISVVGKANSGKTYLLEQLLPMLTSRGYRVATVKHDVHGFEIDHEGKDSWRHKKAGACTVVLASPAKMAIIADTGHELTLEEICSRWLQDVDLILTEGYKRASFPKIEAKCFGETGELLCTEKDNLIAVVSREPLAVRVPVFRESEIHRLADLLEERFLMRPRRGSVLVLRGGQPLHLATVWEKTILKLSWVVKALCQGRNARQSFEVRIQWGEVRRRRRQLRAKG